MTLWYKHYLLPHVVYKDIINWFNFLDVYKALKKEELIFFQYILKS